MVAHTTQFVQPGWRFADSGACKLLADGSGSVVSYVSPTGKDLSIVIETAESNATQTIGLRLGGEFASLKQLHMWKTERAAVFIEQAPLAVAGGVATLSLQPGTVVTLTTTTGQKKGGQGSTIPPRTNFSLPYSDDFDSVLEDHTPKYTSDMHGVFTAATEASVGGKVLQQRTAIRPVSTAGSGNIYATIIGDGSWIDYQVSITARLPKASAEATPAVEAAAAVCTLNESVGRCGGLTQMPNATSLAECQALCCELWRTPGKDCETAQWCPTGVTECDTKWAKSGRCWVGKACSSTDKAGWQTASRVKPGPGPQPHKPPPPPPPPFLFLASNIGVFKASSTCILSGAALPEVCDEPVAPGRAPANATSDSCCPVGKGGLVPAMIHSEGTPDPAGAVLRVDFAAGGNAKWVLSAAKECEASGRGCTTSAVATGTVPWALGEWRTLRLAAKRQANGQTQLTWSVSGASKPGEVHTATVATIDEARGGVAFGNSMASPLSQWDNLTVTPLPSQ